MDDDFEGEQTSSSATTVKSKGGNGRTIPVTGPAVYTVQVTTWTTSLATPPPNKVTVQLAKATNQLRGRAHTSGA